MILLQATAFLSPKAASALEILLLLSLATGLGWAISRLLYAGRVTGLRDRIADKQAQLEECQRQKPTARPATVLETPWPMAPVSPLPGINTSIASPVLEVPATAPDDLKIVEGIGPKIEELLNNDGILTFAQLSATPTDRLREILHAAGPRYQIHDPGTWPQQADLAAQEKWDELTALQLRLRAGRP